MKKKWLVTGLTALVVLSIFWFAADQKDSGEKPAYRLAQVSQGSIKATVSSSGTVNPLNTVKVGSQVSGIIKTLYVDFNAGVKRDQVVALIDPSFYEAQLEQARAQVLMAKAQHLENQMAIQSAKAAIDSAAAQLDSAKATLQEAELTLHRVQRLDQKQMVPKADLDSARTRKKTSIGALGMAQAQVRSAQASLDRTVAQQQGSRALIAQREAALHLAGIQLDYCTIKSPINGTVISRHVDAGQTVSASLQSPILFTIAEDLTRMQVEVDVSEADVGQIQAGQKVEFTVDAFPEKRFSADVRQVRNAPNRVQNVVTYTIVADVQNTDLLLRPGMTANATVIVDEVSNVLKVPNAALRFKPPLEGKKKNRQDKVSVRKRKGFNHIVERLNLDAVQADQLEVIIKNAGETFKGMNEPPEDQQDIRQARKKFFVEIHKNLYRILKPDQYASFKAYMEDFKASLEKRRQNKKLRPANVYIQNDEGVPEARRIMAGITDESHTEIMSEELKPGDKVIIGMTFDSSAAQNQSADFLSMILRRK